MAHLACQLCRITVQSSKCFIVSPTDHTTSTADDPNDAQNYTVLYLIVLNVNDFFSSSITNQFCKINLIPTMCSCYRLPPVCVATQKSNLVKSIATPHSIQPAPILSMDEGGSDHLQNVCSLLASLRLHVAQRGSTYTASDSHDRAACLSVSSAHLTLSFMTA